MSRRRFKEDNKRRDARLAELYYINQMTLQAIGQQYGLSRERVRQIVSEQDHPRAEARRADRLKMTSPGVIRVMQEMRQQGYTYAAIADHFDNVISRQRVQQILSPATK